MNNGNDSDSDNYLFANTSDSNKTVSCKMIINSRHISFLIDSGATVNTLPKTFARNILDDSTVKLKSYCNNSVKNYGTTIEEVQNPKTQEYHHIKFVVVDN